jgi:hypothetical protein
MRERFANTLGCWSHDECLISDRVNKEAPRPKAFDITCSLPMYASRKPATDDLSFPEFIYHKKPFAVSPSQCKRSLQWKQCHGFHSRPSPTFNCAVARVRTLSTSWKEFVEGRPRFRAHHGYAHSLLKEMDHFRRMHVDHLGW